MAAERGRVETVRYLVDVPVNGANNVNITDREGVSVSTDGITTAGMS